MAHLVSLNPVVGLSLAQFNHLNTHVCVRWTGSILFVSFGSASQLLRKSLVPGFRGTDEGNIVRKPHFLQHNALTQYLSAKS